MVDDELGTDVTLWICRQMQVEATISDEVHRIKYWLVVCNYGTIARTACVRFGPYREASSINETGFVETSLQTLKRRREAG